MSIDMARVYTDFEGLAALKAKARNDEEAALDEVSRQFESMFLQMMLKSMRDASFGGGLLDSKQSEFYRDMHDQQLAVDLAQKKSIGLAAVIKRQLGGGAADEREGLQPAAYRDRPIARPTVAAGRPADDADPTMTVALDGSPNNFLSKLRSAAGRAAAELGIEPEALLAQAALETGWGRHVMRHGDGRSSHNLFGIKADRRWQGDRVEVETLEYRDGVPLKTRAAFRSYDSFDASFEDYVQFLRQNPRYRDALKETAEPARYFEALQQAGYATDPVYADKIMRVYNGESMQIARQAARGT